jgi:hypothetical protein
MNNPNLHTALFDLVCGICSVTLGSVEKEVIYEAGKALIFNWNDHNPDRIDEGAEFDRWRNECGR